MEQIIITNREDYPIHQPEDAGLLELKNGILQSELDAAYAEIERQRKVIHQYVRRMNRAYLKTLKGQAGELPPLVYFTFGVMTVLALTGLVLMIV